MATRHYSDRERRGKKPASEALRAWKTQTDKETHRKPGSKANPSGRYHPKINLIHQKQVSREDPGWSDQGISSILMKYGKTTWREKLSPSLAAGHRDGDISRRNIERWTPFCRENLQKRQPARPRSYRQLLEHQLNKRRRYQSLLLSSWVGMWQDLMHENWRPMEEMHVDMLVSWNWWSGLHREWNRKLE